jgi:hypothetical protein
LRELPSTLEGRILEPVNHGDDLIAYLHDHHIPSILSVEGDRRPTAIIVNAGDHEIDGVGLDVNEAGRFVCLNIVYQLNATP